MPSLQHDSLSCWTRWTRKNVHNDEIQYSTLGWGAATPPIWTQQFSIGLFFFPIKSKNHKITYLIKVILNIVVFSSHFSIRFFSILQAVDTKFLILHFEDNIRPFQLPILMIQNHWWCFLYLCRLDSSTCSLDKFIPRVSLFFLFSQWRTILLFTRGGRCAPAFPFRVVCFFVLFGWGRKFFSFFTSLSVYLSSLRLFRERWLGLIM